MIKYRYLFGPIKSRRLGLSLGIDLVPLKTCTLDCCFCQAGSTTEKTIVRDEYAPTKAVLAEISSWYESGGRADVLTLSGSGEPTLHSRFGDILVNARAETGIKTALLSNGSLFYDKDVRDSAMSVDIVKVSLNAWDQASFERLMRPHPDLRFDAVVEGWRRFRAQFDGELWIEVFLIRGQNDSETDVRRISEIVSDVRPDRVHLNTAVRRPSEDFVLPLNSSRLAILAKLFDPVAEVPDSSGKPDGRPLGASSG